MLIGEKPVYINILIGIADVVGIKNPHIDIHHIIITPVLHHKLPRMRQLKEEHAFFTVKRMMGCVQLLSAGSGSSFGTNLRAMPLLHQRSPRGGGPSLNTWP